MIVKTGDNGEITRLRDIGRVELGAQTYGQAFTLDGKQAAGIGIYQSPGANALDVEHAVKAKMEELAREFPQGLVYSVPFDTTVFVNASIHEVYKTLIEAAVLVLIVILVFLQDWRAMLVPATTVPVTIIGAFAAMWALGFTVNFSTLFAIVLSIGIVVDDAIVVVEGAAHNIEKGMSGHDAAIRAMNELLGPIIGITLVLMSVFLPAAFLPGLTGRMYAQFALVIAATALLSAINAVTLKPTQAAMWLRPPVPPERRNAFYRGFNAVYGRLERSYAGLIGRMVAHAGLMTHRSPSRSWRLAFWGLARVPTGFLPIEDQGYLLVAVQLPDGAALGAHAGRRSNRSPQSRARTTSVDQVIGISGVSVARQQRHARQCRRRLCGAQGLERARRLCARLCPAVAGARRRRCARDRAAAAADPGHRQCRRLHHADRAARRQHGSRQTAEHHQYDRRQRAIAERAAAGFDLVPRRRAAIARRRRSREGADAARLGRSGVLDAGDLFRLELCRAVQQVRPRVSGLCAGRRPIPAAAARYRKSFGAQSAGRHDSAGNARHRSSRPSARR